MNFFMRRGCARDTRGQMPPFETQQSRFSHGGCPQSLPGSYQLIRILYGDKSICFFLPKNDLLKFEIFLQI